MMEIEYTTVLGRLVNGRALRQSGGFSTTRSGSDSTYDNTGCGECLGDIKSVINISKMSQNPKCDPEARRYAGRQ